MTPTPALAATAPAHATAIVRPALAAGAPAAATPDWKWCANQIRGWNRAQLFPFNLTVSGIECSAELYRAGVNGARFLQMTEAEWRRILPARILDDVITRLDHVTRWLRSGEGPPHGAWTAANMINVTKHIMDPSYRPWPLRHSQFTSRVQNWSVTQVERFFALSGDRGMSEYISLHRINGAALLQFFPMDFAHALSSMSDIELSVGAISALQGAWRLERMLLTSQRKLLDAVHEVDGMSDGRGGLPGMSATAAAAASTAAASQLPPPLPTSHPSELFLDLDNDLHCSVCFEVPFDPPNLACSHIFCRSCIEPKDKPRLQNCPNCRAALPSTLVANPFAAQQICKLKVKCEHHAAGCKATFALGANQRGLTEHRAKCEYVPRPCELCKQQVSTKDKRLHGADQCSERPVVCEHCNEPQLASKLAAHQSVATVVCLAGQLPCQGWTICPYGCVDEKTGAPLQFLRGDLVPHKRVCGETLVECAYCPASAQHVLTRRAYFDHLRERGAGAMPNFLSIAIFTMQRQAKVVSEDGVPAVAAATAATSSPPDTKKRQRVEFESEEQKKAESQAAVEDEDDDVIMIERDDFFASAAARPVAPAAAASSANAHAASVSAAASASKGAVAPPAKKAKRESTSTAANAAAESPNKK